MLKWLYGKCECRVESGGDLCYEVEEGEYRCLQCGMGYDILLKPTSRKKTSGWLR